MVSLKNIPVARFPGCYCWLTKVEVYSSDTSLTLSNILLSMESLVTRIQEEKKKHQSGDCKSYQMHPNNSGDHHWQQRRLPNALEV